MKILHILYQSLPNTKGSSIRSRDIVLSQKKIGIEPIVITSPFQPPKTTGNNIENIDGIIYYRTFNGNYEQIVTEKKSSLYKKVKKIVQIFPFTILTFKIAKHENIDLIHAHATFFTAFSGKIVSLLLKKPFVYEIRSLWEERDKASGNVVDIMLANLVKLFETIAMKSADKIVVINKNLKDDIIKRGIKESKIVVIPNAVNILTKNNSQITINTKSDKNITFGYIGSVSPIEGLDNLCLIFSNLEKKGYPNKLLIYGAGPKFNDIEKFVKENNLKNIKLLGAIPSEDIQKAYASIDVIINPRIKSKLTDTVTPLKPLEAMLYKKLIIATNIGGMKELIIDKKTGILYQHDNNMQLEKIIIDIINNPKKYISIIENGYKFVIEKKNWDINAKNYFNIYFNLINDLSKNDSL